MVVLDLVGACAVAAVQEGRVELGLLEKAPVRPSEEAREVVQVVVVVSERAEAVAAVQEGGAEVGVLDDAQVRGGSVSLGLGVGRNGLRWLFEATEGGMHAHARLAF